MGRGRRHEGQRTRQGLGEEDTHCCAWLRRALRLNQLSVQSVHPGHVPQVSVVGGWACSWLVRWLALHQSLMTSMSTTIAQGAQEQLLELPLAISQHVTLLHSAPKGGESRHSCTPYASPPGRYASGTRYAAGCGRFRSCHARHLRYAASGAAHSARPRAPAAASCVARKA